jgi:hypothetical protein
MKSLILAVALTFTLPVFAEAETKKACVMQKDQKTGKEKEVCKEIKVHKKLDGTKVPEKK